MSDSPAAILHNTSSVEVGTAANPLRVDPTGTTAQAITSGAVVDAGNSTTTPLGSYGKFVGTAVNVLGYSQVTVVVSTDQPTLANGVVLEFSPDGVTWNHSHKFTINDPVHVVFFMGLSTQGKFFRTVVCNGAQPQSRLDVQTTLRPIASVGSVRGMDSPPDVDDDGLLTQSVVIGRDATGKPPFRSATVSGFGHLDVDADDDEAREILRDILNELRKHSLWFSMMTGVDLKNGDVD